MNISIIICCYNSANRIKPTLVHIAHQDLLDFSSEVIVVDNNCTDDTISVAKKVWMDCNNPFSLRIVEEKRAGLSYARNTGVMAARGEIIIFCDDDNWLDKDYCKIAYKIMDSDASIGALGGRGLAVSDDDLPHWFTTYQGGYAVGVQSMNSGFIDERGYLWGAGMVLRNDDMRKLLSAGFKSALTDRVGNNLTSGGDSEICKWFLIIGKHLYYSEKLIFKHYIEQKRLKKEYLIKLHEGHKQSPDLLAFYNIYILCYGNTKNKLNMKKRVGILLYYFFKNKKNRNTLFECFNKTSIVFCRDTRYLKRCVSVYYENATN